MNVGVTVLGSGSKGNSILIHCDDSAVMIDAGFSKKALLEKLVAAGIEPSIIEGILISHEHSDHVSGVRVFSDQLSIPVYASRDTFAILKSKKQIGESCFIFEPGCSFNVGKYLVEPFTVPHDAIQPVAFVVKIGDFTVGVATDLGHMNTLAMMRLKNCDVLCLESNYDMGLLRESERPMSLKRRVMGKHGHLCNDDAIEALGELIGEKTKHLILAHVSSDCNDYELVAKLGLEKLAKLERSDIVLTVAKQNEIMPTAWIK